MTDGFTGASEEYEPAGIVHRGEELIPGASIGLPGVVLRYTDTGEIIAHWPTHESWERTLEGPDD